MLVKRLSGRSTSADILVVVYDLKFAECREEQLLQGHRKWKVQGFVGSKFASK